MKRFSLFFFILFLSMSLAAKDYHAVAGMDTGALQALIDKACRGGGVLQYFDPRKVKAEAFLAFHAHEVGCYMDDQELMLITGNGIVIRTDVESIGIKKGKITSGVKIQKLEEDDKVAALDTIAIDGEDEESPSQGDLFQQK